MANQKGFTLVELLVIIVIGLLVIIVIVGLLLGITFGEIKEAMEKARVLGGLEWSRRIHTFLSEEAVGLWHLDENPASHGALIRDFSGQGNNGTLFTNDGPTNKSVSGALRNALSFDGVDDYVSVPHSASLNLTSSFTYEFWFKVLGAGTDGKIYWTLLNKNPTSSRFNDPAHFLINTAWILAVRVGNGVTSYTLSSGVNVNDGKFHHAVLSFDDAGDIYRLYLDGIERATQSVSVTWVPTTNIGPLTFGVWPAYAAFFNGIIDEVRIYRRALTTAQIESLYYAGLERLLAQGLIDEEEYQQHLAKKNLETWFPKIPP